MKVGSLVKWASPADQAEASERFQVLEVNGDRCRIRFVSDLPINPVMVARVADLIEA